MCVFVYLKLAFNSGGVCLSISILYAYPDVCMFFWFFALGLFCLYVVLSDAMVKRAFCDITGYRRHEQDPVHVPVTVPVPLPEYWYCDDEGYWWQWDYDEGGWIKSRWWQRDNWVLWHGSWWWWDADDEQWQCHM